MGSWGSGAPFWRLFSSVSIGDGVWEAETAEGRVAGSACTGKGRHGGGLVVVADGMASERGWQEDGAQVNGETKAAVWICSGETRPEQG